RNAVAVGRTRWRDVGRKLDDAKKANGRAELARDLDRRIEHARRTLRCVEGDEDTLDHASTSSGRFARNMNIGGRRKRERIVDEVRPPTTASASGWFASVPFSSASAVGTSPMIVARLVIAIGTKRMRAAVTTAPSFSAPSAKRRLASSTSKMPFE